PPPPVPSSSSRPLPRRSQHTPRLPRCPARATARLARFQRTNGSSATWLPERTAPPIDRRSNAAHAEATSACLTLADFPPVRVKCAPEGCMHRQKDRQSLIVCLASVLEMDRPVQAVAEDRRNGEGGSFDCFRSVELWKVTRG